MRTVENICDMYDLDAVTDQLTNRGKSKGVTMLIIMFRRHTNQ
jgi:hypothetical protein